MFKNTCFKEHHRATASDYTFIERKTSTFRTKTLRIYTSELMVLIKKSRYLPHFLNIEKKIQKEALWCLVKEDTVI